MRAKKCDRCDVTITTMAYLMDCVAVQEEQRNEP